MMPRICVAHLVREVNGIQPFASFLRSYRERRAGAAHELIVIFKGFSGGVLPKEYRDILHGLPHRTFFFPDEGIDTLPYFAAARNFEHTYFCFLNSFSVILDDDWLLKMYKHIVPEDVGVVSATASHESLYDYYIQSWPSRSRLRLWLKFMVRHREMIRVALRKRIDFAPFPNYHVRFNAFIIRRDVMLKLKVGEVVDKEDAYRFESGRSGMTRQIQKMGLKPLVVGRDGVAYEKEHWYESFTFRSGNQQNLIVADNQTRLYADANPAEKKILSQSTWQKS